MMTTVPDTPRQKVLDIYSKQRAYAPILAQSTATDRIKKLNKIQQYLTNKANTKRLMDALAADLSKPEVEVMTSELGVLLSSLRDIKKKLRFWMKDKAVSTPLAMTGASSYIKYEPKGVALIISPWNYPFQLCINPLLYAIAAGCAAMLKPSEYSCNTSQYIAGMIADLFEEKEVAVCQGGIPTSTILLEQPFDHMYFTGSPTVGKIVMKAAAQHLASVTLELGGKSPCFVLPKVNVAAAAKKLAWGKFFNTGQTCIAPDYALVPSHLATQLTQELTTAIKTMYNKAGKGIKHSPDLGRLIGDKHYSKVLSMLHEAVNDGATIAYGGSHDPDTRYIEPTILTNINPTSTILKEEIFGPILPIVTYDSLDEAITFTNGKPKPLALYILGDSRKKINHIINNTSAGGTVINDFLLHFANHNLPFGGVNNSGIGKSHGKHGFVAFSNERAIMKNKWALTHILHPPYTNISRRFASLLGKWI